MQEEVESRTVNLAISTTKLTARSIVAAVRSYLRLRAESKPIGKQSVKDRNSQDEGESSIDMGRKEQRGFKNIARKYGIDYAIRKDRSVDPPKYLVFFKSRDTDAMTAAFNEYSQKVMRKEERPSILQQLKDIKALVAALPGKVKVRDKQREQMR